MAFTISPAASTLTLAEQVVDAELAYYRQLEHCEPTPTDLIDWEHIRTTYEAFNPTHEFPAIYDCSLYARYILERHGYSLHRYMASNLCPEAWQQWAKNFYFRPPIFSLNRYQGWADKSI